MQGVAVRMHVVEGLEIGSGRVKLSLLSQVSSGPWSMKVQHSLCSAGIILGAWLWLVVVQQCACIVRELGHSTGSTSDACQLACQITGLRCTSHLLVAPSHWSAACRMMAAAARTCP